MVKMILLVFVFSLFAIADNLKRPLPELLQEPTQNEMAENRCEDEYRKCLEKCGNESDTDADTCAVGCRTQFERCNASRS